MCYVYLVTETHDERITGVRDLSMLLDEKEEKQINTDAPKIDLFTQWLVQFNASYTRNIPFDLDTFQSMVNSFEIDSMAISKMKYENYMVPLNDKTYINVLKSFMCWTVTLKCTHWRCGGKSKLNCFCDINTFQLYTYSIINNLIKLKTNSNYIILNSLKNIHNAQQETAKYFCTALLPEYLQSQSYFKVYIELVIDWLNFEWYNFQCINCHHINKTVMIGRTYQFVKTMTACRVCNTIDQQRTTFYEMKFDINKLQSKNSTTLNVTDECVGMLDNYLKQEEYDSESILLDIQCQSVEESNIHQYVFSTSKDPNYMPLIKKLCLKNEWYQTYKEGAFIRYLVLQPKYSHLLQEICLNDIYQVSKSDWEQTILVSAIMEYEKKTAFSNATDKRFGIEEGEPIGVHHLIAIFLFTDRKFAEYQQFFSKSYYLPEQNTHKNNFYFVGRYLCEAVQFYGKSITLDVEASFYQASQKIELFNSLASVFNSPLLVIDNPNNAMKIAGNNGMIYSLTPKYYGDIDNSKFLDILFAGKNIRMVMGSKLQLRTITLIDPSQNLNTVVLAIQYLEKLLLQTAFDVNFYNDHNLYNPTNMKHAYLLIMDKLGYQETDITEYGRQIFFNWCCQREFVTFETFQFEIHYMAYKLKNFFLDDLTKKINIKNVNTLLPNLKHFRDIDGVLKHVSEDNNLCSINGQDNEFGMSHAGEVKTATDVLINALKEIQFAFEKCAGVLREAFRMKLLTLDITFDSFYRNANLFQKQLVSV
eukprot:91045_1